MSLRNAFLALMAGLLVSQAGCTTFHSCWPCGDTWCGSQCGQCIWSEWFSLPPTCCDPCNCCGEFTESRNPWVRRGGPPLGRQNGQGGPAMGFDNQTSSYGGDYGGPMGPTDEVYSEGPKQMQPTPVEELPPAPPSAGVYQNELGQTVACARPVDSPRTSRRLGDRRPRDFDR
jgi:hypothetical protein